MSVFRQLLPRLLTLAIVCAISFVGVLKQASEPADTAPDPRPAVIIDAGHGGFDGGAVASDGTAEKDINLSIAHKLCSILKFCGYEVIMTRTEDTGTEDDSSKRISERKKSDLKNRLQLINSRKDAVFVSIHLNKFTTSAASGAQVFYSPERDESRLLGESIQKSIVLMLQPDNKRVIKKGGSSTYLLHNAKIPAVIVECGFLSNSAELSRLKDDKYRSQMAYCIAAGITEYLG